MTLAINEDDIVISILRLTTLHEQEMARLRAEFLGTNDSRQDYCDAIDRETAIFIDLVSKRAKDATRTIKDGLIGKSFRELRSEAAAQAGIPYSPDTPY